VALRRTESRLPFGFGPNMLGTAYTSWDGNAVLICREAPHIAVDENFDSDPSRLVIAASYAVFVNEPDESRFPDYEFKWDVTFDRGGETELSAGYGDEGGSISVSVSDIRHQMVYVHLEISYGGDVWQELESELPVRPLDQRMEELYGYMGYNPGNAAGRPPGALAGEISISRRMSNSLWKDVLFAVSANNALVKDKAASGIPAVTTLPARFLGAVLYLLMLKNRGAEDQTALSGDAEAALNAADAQDGAGDFRRFVLGISRISKEQAALCDGSLDGLSDMDFFNLSRFPRGNICLLASMLSSLKKSSYDDYSAEKLFGDRDAMAAIARPFFEAIGYGVSAAGMAAKAAKTAGFPFISVQPDAVSGFETVRILVLDCRSGQPVAGARVKRVIITGLTDTYFQLDSQPVAASGPLKPQDPANPASPPERQYGIKDSQTALARFCSFTGTELKPKYGLSEKDKDPADTYSSVSSRLAYNAYWDERLCSFMNVGVSPDPPTDPPIEHCAMIAEEYNAHRATNDRGILEIKLPYACLQTARELTVEVGFHDFPVALGKLVKDTRQGAPDAPQGQPTGYRSVWAGSQNMNWRGDTGWRLVSGGPANTGGPLMTAESMLLKTAGDPSFPFMPECYSVQYATNDNHPHFVLYAMQWCQPVWDGVGDPPGDSQRGNQYAFVNQRYSPGGPWVKDLNLHIVTRYYAANSNAANPPTYSSGHYYGFYRAVGAPSFHRKGPHPGVDVYSGQSAQIPCFACHGGWLVQREQFYVDDQNVTHYDQYDGYGEYLMLYLLHQRRTDKEVKSNGQIIETLVGTDGPLFLYAHLGEREPEARVLCGQVIGKTGDTGNMSDPALPRHVHFELKPSSARGNGIQPNQIASVNGLSCDAENVKIMPGNGLPLILPCACTYGGTGASYPTSCNITGYTYKDNNNKDVTVNYFASCWAVQEFPYTDDIMLRSANNIGEDRPDSMLPGPILPKPSIEFICPKIFVDDPRSNKEAQLQAKLKWVCNNIESGIGDTSVSGGVVIDGSIQTGGKTMASIIKFINICCIRDANAPQADAAKAAAFKDRFTGKTVHANDEIQSWVDTLNGFVPWRTPTP